MEDEFTWSGHARLVLVLLTLALHRLEWFSLFTFYHGGFAFVLIAGMFLIIFAVPQMSLQVLIGQYAKMGPMGIWKAFPLARGLGVVWLLFIAIASSIYVIDVSRNFVYLLATVSIQDFPWTKCNQNWNSENCRPYTFHEAQPSMPLPTIALWDVEMPAYEFFLSTRQFSVEYVFAILLTWLLILVPLIHGPKSLIKSFYVLFSLILLLNTLLFFRGITLPNVAKGLGAVFSPHFFRFGELSAWNTMIYVIFGTWFGATNGSLFLVGKYADERIFPFPHVLIGAVLFLVMGVLNLFKTSGFAAGFTSLVQLDWIIFFDENYTFTTIPVLLSQLPGATFWLLVHFVYCLCIQLPIMSFAVETIATSCAEFLPSFLASRTSFPKNLALTATLGILGFLISITLHYLNCHYLIFVTITDFLYTLQNVAYLFAFMIVSIAIVPLSLSEVVNHQREDLLTFVNRHSSASLYKVLTVICIVISGILTVVAPLCILFALAEKGHYVITAIIGLAVIILIVTIFFLVHSVLHCRNESRYPCCSPLGRRLEEEENASFMGEKVELYPVVS